MHEESIRSLACQLRQTRVDAGDINRDIWIRDRTWVEEGGHQGQLVITPAEVQGLTSLPGMPECPNRLDLLAQHANHQFGPGHPKPLFDMSF